jgi:hypothetical protein
MRLVLIAAVVALSFTPQTPGSAQAQAPAGPRVQITFEPGGLVSLVSNGATLREVLAEWTRQGGSTFVNSERLAQTPLILQFSHQPERDVMASLLRPAAGYLLGPRRAGSIGASSFEVVYILPTSNPSMSGNNFSQPVPYQQQQFSTAGAPDDELAPVGRGAPPPQPGQPPPTPAPTPDYNRPAGVSPVAVPVVPITTTSPPPTQPPPPPGRGGASGS